MTTANARMTFASELRRGALQLAILASLEEEHYGYELLARLRAVGLTIEEGTFYPALRRLETAGLLVGRAEQVGGRVRRYYRLSPAGREALAELTGSWRGLVGAISPLLVRTGEAAASRDQEVQARLDEIERLRSEFLYAVAHELRTPLTLVRTAASLLLEGGADEATQQRLLRDIRQSVDQLHTLVTDLLDLARLRGGKLDIQLGYLDLTELVCEVVELMRSLASSKRQRLTVHAPEPGPRVLGDRRRIGQILLNLLSNAHKFAPVEGEIDVRVEDRRTHVLLSVSDTGPGIAPEDQPHLFERFWIGRTGAGQGASGSGLGLPIAQGLVEAHGGTIWVESAVGRGTTFHVLLPKERPDEDPGR